MTGEGGPLEVTLFLRLKPGEVRSGDPGEGLKDKNTVRNVARLSLC